ncbi:MAG TPA: glycosyltransferase family 39 protein [Blastocatellia bacterium]|nr:glycosyltransferase family 39 protein [Blastocatellia bacterium]
MHEIALSRNAVGGRLKLRYLVLPAAVIFCGALVYAHLQAAQRGEAYQGVWMPVDRLFDLSLATAVMALAFCVGRRGARWLRLSFANRAEEVSVSAMMGVGLVGLVLLGLGLARMLAPLPVALSLALLVALSWRESMSLYAAIKQGVATATASRARLALALLFAALVAVLMLRALTPPHAYDEAIYHLPATKAFVDHARVYPLVDNAAGNMPFLMQMIYAVCLMAKTDVAPRVLSLIVALTCAMAVYGFCARFLSRRTGVVAAFAFFGAGMVIEVSVTCRVDVSLACMLFVATHAMMVSLKTGERGWLVASALMSGFALGIKHTAAVWILLLGVMFLLESLMTKSAPASAVIKRAALYAAVTLLVASPWFVKNQVWFHNPIYPFATGEVAALDAGRVSYFTPADEAKLDAHFEQVRRALPALVEKREAELAAAVASRAIQHPPHAWEYFTDPDRYNSPEQYHEPNYLFLFAPLLLLVRRSRRVVWLAALGVGYFVLLTQVVWHSRYLLPVYPALTVVVAYVLTGLGEWAAAKRRSALLSVATKALPAVALVVTLGPLAFTSVMQFAQVRGPEYLAGQLSRRGFMSAVFYYPAIDYINHALPQDARVMMIGAQMSYGLRRDYVADTSLDTLGWQRLLVRNDSMSNVADDLKRQGVTHLLVGYSIFTWGATRGGSASLMTSDLLQKSRPDYYVQLRNGTTLDLFLRQYAEAIYSDPSRQVLYRLK